MKDVPFHKMYLHRLVRTEDGKKMSKSSGTAVDPLKMIEQYGTDALRFTLTSLLTSGSQDVKLGEDKIKASRNFMNKIWNVARFVLQFSATSANDQTTLSDQWILSRFAHTHELVTQKMNEFDFGAAAKAIYDFTWSEYCDWYIEMFKMGGNRKVLLQVLEGILTLMHPIAPFISEELWEQLGHKDRLIVGAWNIFSAADLQAWKNAAIEKDFQWIIDTVTAMRNLRATYQVDHKKALSAYVVTQNEKLKSLLEQNKNFILKLANSNQLEIVAQLPAGLADAAMNVVRDVEVHVPLATCI
jgi:valyl-tRNA synthetase